MKKNILKELETDILKGVGKKCKDFNYACWTCQVWMAFDIIKDFYEV